MESAARSGVEEGGVCGTYGAALRLSWSEREGRSAECERWKATGGNGKSRRGRGKDKAEAGGERGRAEAEGETV